MSVQKEGVSRSTARFTLKWGTVKEKPALTLEKKVTLEESALRLRTVEESMLQLWERGPPHEELSRKSKRQ